MSPYFGSHISAAHTRLCKAPPASTRREFSVSPSTGGPERTLAKSWTVLQLAADAALLFLVIPRLEWSVCVCVVCVCVCVCVCKSVGGGSENLRSVLAYCIFFLINQFHVKILYY